MTVFGYAAADDNADSEQLAIEREGIVYGYARVSKGEFRGEDEAANLSNQIRRIEQAGAETVYAEVISGGKFERDQLSKLLDIIKEGDTVLFTRLDRLGRSLLMIIQTIERFNNLGVKVLFIDQPGLTGDDPMSKALLGMNAIFAQLQRDLTTQASAAGVAVAAENGRFPGRKWNMSRQQMILIHRLRTIEHHSWKLIAGFTGKTPSACRRVVQSFPTEEDIMALPDNAFRPSN